MHPSYLKALKEAAERTAQIPNLAVPKGAQYWASGRAGLVWNQEDTIGLAIRALLACVPDYLRAREEDTHLTFDMQAEYIARNCFEFHAAATQYLDACRVRHDLVIGDVLVGGVPHYHASVEGLLAATTLPENTKGIVPGHCWLTLEDGTILDGTLRAALSASDIRRSPWSMPDLIHLGTWDPEQGAARWVPDLIGSGAAHVEYVPLLIGAELTRAVAGMPPA